MLSNTSWYVLQIYHKHKDQASKLKKKQKKTSMHSSRMRTARLLPVSPSMHCTGECLLPGGVCSGGMATPGGRGCLPCEQNDWQTGVKTYPSQTSFAGGNNTSSNTWNRSWLFSWYPLGFDFQFLLLEQILSCICVLPLEDCIYSLNLPSFSWNGLSVIRE